MVIVLATTYGFSAVDTQATVLNQTVADVRERVVNFCIFAISFVLALLSWRFLEQPFLRLKKYFSVRSEAAGRLQPDVA